MSNQLIVPDVGLNVLLAQAGGETYGGCLPDASLLNESFSMIPFP